MWDLMANGLPASNSGDRYNFGNRRLSCELPEHQHPNMRHRARRPYPALSAAIMDSLSRTKGPGHDKRHERLFIKSFIAVVLVLVVSILAISPLNAAPQDYDTNGNNVIDRDELLSAIRDHLFTDKLTRDELLVLIRLHLFEEPVVTEPRPELSGLSLTHGVSGRGQSRCRQPLAAQVIRTLPVLVMKSYSLLSPPWGATTPPS